MIVALKPRLQHEVQLGQVHLVSHEGEHLLAQGAKETLDLAAAFGLVGTRVQHGDAEAGAAVAQLVGGERRAVLSTYQGTRQPAALQRRHQAVAEAVDRLVEVELGAPSDTVEAVRTLALIAKRRPRANGPRAGSQ